MESCGSRRLIRKYGPRHPWWQANWESWAPKRVAARSTCGQRVPCLRFDFVGGRRAVIESPPTRPPLLRRQRSGITLGGTRNGSVAGGARILGARRGSRQGLDGPGDRGRRCGLLRPLAAELRGERPTKTDVVRRLQAFMPARTTGSIEFKLSNISAVLEEVHEPWIDGYKPYHNYQGALRTAVLDRIRRSHRVGEVMAEYVANSLPAPTRSPRATEDIPGPASIGHPTGTAESIDGITDRRIRRSSRPAEPTTWSGRRGIRPGSRAPEPIPARQA